MNGKEFDFNLCEGGKRVSMCGESLNPTVLNSFLWHIAVFISIFKSLCKRGKGVSFVHASVEKELTLAGVLLKIMIRTSVSLSVAYGQTLSTFIIQGMEMVRVVNRDIRWQMPGVWCSPSYQPRANRPLLSFICVTSAFSSEECAWKIIGEEMWSWWWWQEKILCKIQRSCIKIMFRAPCMWEWTGWHCLQFA